MVPEAQAAPEVSMHYSKAQTCPSCDATPEVRIACRPGLQKWTVSTTLESEFAWLVR